VVDHGRHFRVRVEPGEAATELIPLEDVDEPRIVFGAVVAEGEQLLEHDGDFDSVGRAPRIQLQGMTPDWQSFLESSACHGSVDVRERAAARLLPGPDLRGNIVGILVHFSLQSEGDHV
jgi:hypothetical protein